jgi:hypothetical protein
MDDLVGPHEQGLRDRLRRLLDRQIAWLCAPSTFSS